MAGDYDIPADFRRYLEKRADEIEQKRDLQNEAKEKRREFFQSDKNLRALLTEDGRKKFFEALLQNEKKRIRKDALKMRDIAKEQT